jgi:hypothetical protein
MSRRGGFVGEDAGPSTDELLAAWREAIRQLDGAGDSDPDRPLLEAQARRAARAYHARLDDVTGHLRTDPPSAQSDRDGGARDARRPKRASG